MVSASTQAGARSPAATDRPSSPVALGQSDHVPSTRRWRPGVRVILSVIVLLPLLATAVLAVGSARSAWASRGHAQVVADDARQLQMVAAARAQMNRVELALTAVSYARQIGITESELDTLLHPAVPFQQQIAEQIGALAQYPTFSSTRTLRADVAALPDVVLSIAQGSATFSQVHGFVVSMARTIDDVWYQDFDRLQADVAAWSPPGSFEVHAAALRQTYQAFLSGGQEIESAVFVLEGIGPSSAKQELIQAAGVFQSATGEFTGQLSPQAEQAWRHLQTDPADVHFAATIHQALAVALNGTTSPFARDLAFAGAASAPGLQYLADLNKLVTAASQDLHDTALAQAAAATHHLVGESLFLIVLTLICVTGIGLTGGVLTRPFKRLASQALQVHDGDFDLEPLPPTGPREVATTTEAFNDMALTLKAVETKAVALAAEDLSHPELVAPLPGRTGRALQASIDALSTRIRERELQRQLLHEAATHDALTGLLNRRAVFDYLTHDVSRRREAGETVAVLFIDLDGLKPLNDTHGHGAGDAAIAATALALTHATDDCDVVGRLGGDEFLVVLCHDHSCHGDTVVERIRRTVANCRIPVEDGVVPLEASVGVALARCDYDTDPMMLVRQADEAMYEAKKAARANRERAAAGT